MPSIAVVTTSKGRLHHIQQTLPGLMEEGADEVIVVDYGCPDQTGNWVQRNYPQVKVVTVSDDAGWCAARARNAGASHVTADWIWFLDADVKIQPGFVDWMLRHLNSRFHYRISSWADEGSRGLWGTFICPRHAFEQVEGYDELFRGWGVEDTDLYRRLVLSGCPRAVFPQEFLSAIEHDDRARLRFCQQKDKFASHVTHRFYMEAKTQIMAIQAKGELPLADRKVLMSMVKDRLSPWLAGSRDVVPTISVSANGFGWLPEPYRMLKKLYITLTLENTDHGEH